MSYIYIQPQFIGTKVVYLTDFVLYKQRFLAERRAMRLLGHDDFWVGEVGGNKILRLFSGKRERTDKTELEEVNNYLFSANSEAEDVCFYCGFNYEKHVYYRKDTEPLPRTPCLLLKSRFVSKLELDKNKLVENQRMQLFTDARTLAQQNNQLIGQNNDFYITLEQLEFLLKT